MMTKHLFLSSLCLGLLLFPSHRYEAPEALLYPVPEAFLPDFSDHQVNPTIETQVALDKEGTVLHIPQNAFVDLDGNVVETPVSILYKEYNNAADMAFSRIPMTYKGDNFNSSGMFEIQGKCDGKPVRVAPGKSLTIDYRLAQKNPNTDFYRLNENSRQWELIADIPQMANPINIQNNTQNNIQNINVNIRDIDNRNWNNNLNVPRNQDARGNVLNRRTDNDFVQKDDGNRKNNTLLAENADAGHTYPDIVKGLNVESFGVYNCDQIYRVPNRIDITASFKDESGKPIHDLHVLSLIDLNYNGAFSFNPTGFTCDAKGNNVLLLFSTSNNLYLLDKGAFAKMNIDKSGSYTFTVKNVSSTIRNTADLAKHLGIKI